MNQKSTEARAQIVRCLVEGNSVRATSRMTGAAKNTIQKLLRELGEACSQYQDKVFWNLETRHVQCDEIWSFVGCKQKNVPPGLENEFGIGDVWTWVSMDAESKLVFCWHLGMRDPEAGHLFMREVRRRLKNRVQLTTDGLRIYLNAVPDAFDDDIDYAILVKTYGQDMSAGRYSPPICTGAAPRRVCGNPDPNLISTSYIERQNLTMRMQMRRFTRLTNAFSKKLGGHAAAIALHFMHYNFCRKHQTLGTSPAVASGVADHVWTIEELVGLLEKSN